MKAHLFNYQYLGVFLMGSVFIASSIGCSRKDTDKKVDGNIPIVIVKEKNVLLGDSVHVLISMPGYATNPAPFITIDSVNGVKTGKEPVLVRKGVGYYNELSTK